jgi:hypothetical protein
MRSPRKKLGRRANETRTEKEETRRFVQLAKRFRAAIQPKEIRRLGDELGSMIFGG